MNNRYNRSYYESIPHRIPNGNRGNGSSARSFYTKHARPMSPRSYIRYNQYSEDQEDESSWNYNKYSSNDELSLRNKRRHSFDEDIDVSWEVKLPAPCKLSKTSIVEGEDQKLPLESPASPVEGSTLLSPESPPQPTSAIKEEEEEDSSSKSKIISPEPVPIIPQTPVIHQCRLCTSGITFKSEHDLLVHLTFIHYRNKLMKRVTRPYKCLKCDYTPAVPDDAEDLLMHYGCEEKLSYQFYEQDLKGLDKEEEASDDFKATQVNNGARISLNCQICNSTFDTERLFIRHISLRHFTKVLCDDLPKRSPYICPFLECGKEKTNLHALMLHYGCEHNISMDLYLKETGRSKGPIRVVVDEPPKIPIKSIDPPPGVSIEDSRVSPEVVKKTALKVLVCKKCPKKKFASQMSLNYHLMVTHFFPDLPKVGPYFCRYCEENYPERIDFTKHFLDVHLHEYLEDNSSKKNEKKNSTTSEDVRVTEEKEPDQKTLSTSNGHHHRQSDVRRKITQKWETTSVDVQNHRIEELEKLILDLKNEHEETLKKKSSDFEKWILVKEKQIEDEVEKRKKAEEALENSKLEAIDVQKQLEQARKSKQFTEEMLAEKQDLNLSLIKEKKSLEKEVSQYQEDLNESSRLNANLEMSLKELKFTFDNRGDSLVEKEEEIKDLKEEHSKEINSLRKSISKTEKSVETLRAKLKQSNDEKKAKNAALKENAKKLKDLESELRQEIFQLTKSNKKLEGELSLVKSQVEKFSKTDAKQPDMVQMEKKVEDYLGQLRNSSELIQSLEMEKKSLLDSLEKLQKLLQDYQTVLQEKNEKLRLNKIYRDELETQTQSSSSKLVSDNKELEKKNKELNGKLKNLLNKYNSLENSSTKCSSSISLLAKDKSLLEKQLKECQASVISLEKDLSNLQHNYTKSQGIISSLNDQLNAGESQKAKSDAMIRSRKEEIVSLQARLNESENKCRNFEKQLQEKCAEAGKAHLFAQIKLLESSIHNRDMEIQHLKKNLSQLKEQIRTEKSALESQLNSMKSINEKFEVEYSQKIAELEMFKSKLAEKNRVSDKKALQVHEPRSKIVRKSTPTQISSKQLLNEVDNQNYIIENEKITNDDNDDVRVKVEPPENVMDTVPLFNASEASIILNVGDIKEVVKNSGTFEGINFVPPEVCGNLSPYNSDYEELNFENETLVEGGEEDDESFDSFIFPSSTTPSRKKVTVRKGGGSSKARRSSSSTMEDMTGQFDESDDDVVCGICLQYDPPLPDDAPRSETYNTEWVGCDCGVWYHKLCTKLSKFSMRFSCKSVKKKCLKPSS